MALNKDFFCHKQKEFTSFILDRFAAQTKKRALAVDFGQSAVKIAYLEFSKEGARLLNYSVKKVLSLEEDRQAIIGALAGFLAQNSIAQKEVYLSICDADAVLIRHLALPAMPKEDIAKAARWEFKGEVTFDLNEALIEWQVVREYTDEEGAIKQQIAFVLADTKVINKYLSIIGDCNLTPAGISVGLFNYAHLLRYAPRPPASFALLDIAHQDASFCVYYESKLIFLRKLAFSSDKLTRCLTDTLESDAGRLSLSYEQAEEIKKAVGILQDQSQVLAGGISAIQVISLMRPLLEALVRELKRSFDFYAANFQGLAPGVLYLAGGGASLKNLDTYLQGELKIDVQHLPFCDWIDCQRINKERLQKEKNQIITAIGTALARTPSINLIPAEFKARKFELIEKISLRVVCVTAATILLVSLFFVKMQLRDYQNRLKNATWHLQTIGEIKTMKQKVDLREGFLAKIEAGSIPVDGLLKKISQLMPNEITLEHLGFDRSAHRLSLKGTISGREELAESALTNFMQELEASAFFIEATLVSLRRVGTSQAFEITCELVNLG